MAFDDGSALEDTLLVAFETLYTERERGRYPCEMSKDDAGPIYQKLLLRINTDDLMLRHEKAAMIPFPLCCQTAE